jgi:hypothetical protein
MKKAFKRAAAGLALTAAIAGAVEWNGYHAFDRPDGGNKLCEMDRGCRVMTPGEISATREVFGDTIDYSTVKIFNRSWFGVGVFKNVEAVTPNGNIYLNRKILQHPDFSKATSDLPAFIHEMTHVRQAQHGTNIPLAAIRESLKNSFNYDAAYAYELKPDTKFSALGIEQQAYLIETYVQQRQFLHDMLDSARTPGRYTTMMRDSMLEYCTGIKKDEAVIAQVLPVQAERSCPLPGNLPVPVPSDPLPSFLNFYPGPHDLPTDFYGVFRLPPPGLPFIGGIRPGFPPGLR